MQIDWRADGEDIVFDRGYSQQDYVDFLTRRLGPPVEGEHDLVYVVRTDFAFGEHTFPLFSDDDGYVYLELRALPESVRGSILEKLKK
jgi:hypothetical protein